MRADPGQVRTIYFHLPGNFTFMNIIIETDRLLLRTFTKDDAMIIYELNTDPDITRYTHDPIKDLAHAAEILEKTIIPQYVLYNHGRWSVHKRSTLEFLGWCGLKYRPELNEIDLGYRFKRKAGEKDLQQKQPMHQFNMALKKLVCNE